VTVRSQDWRFQKLEEGEEFQASTVFTDVSDGDIKKVFIEAPDDGSNLSQEVISVASEGKLFIRRFENASEDTEGDLLNASNLRVGDASDSVPFDYRSGGVDETGVYSGGSLEETSLIPGSSGQGQSITGGASVRPAMILSSGNNMLLEFENQSGQTIDFAVKFEFAEVEN